MRSTIETSKLEVNGTTVLSFRIHLLYSFEIASTFSSSNAIRRMPVGRQGYKVPLGSDMFHILPQCLYGAFINPKHSHNESICQILACNYVMKV